MEKGEGYVILCILLSPSPTGKRSLPTRGGWQSSIISQKIASGRWTSPVGGLGGNNWGLKCSLWCIKVCNGTGFRIGLEISLYEEKTPWKIFTGLWPGEAGPYSIGGGSLTLRKDLSALPKKSHTSNHPSNTRQSEKNKQPLWIRKPIFNGKEMQRRKDMVAHMAKQISTIKIKYQKNELFPQKENQQN